MAPPYELIRRCFGYKFPRLGSTAHNLFFKLTPTRIETELFPGIHVRLDSRDLTQRTTYWQGDRFEYPTAQILSKWVTASTTHFFDIGSNYGFFSYLILSRFNRLVVHAFEPNPKTFALLERIKEENNLTQFHPHWMGLSDVQDTLILHPGISDSGHSTFGPHPELLSTCDTRIPVEAFDHWAESAGITSPDRNSWIAKIDVEGFEFRVLKGMKESLLSRAFAGLAVEINAATLEFSGANPEEIFSFMDSVGYQETFSNQTFARNSNAFFIPKK